MSAGSEGDPIGFQSTLPRGSDFMYLYLFPFMIIAFQSTLPRGSDIYTNIQQS